MEDKYAEWLKFRTEIHLFNHFGFVLKSLVQFMKNIILKMFLGYFTELISAEAQFARESAHILTPISLPLIYSLTDAETSQ